MAAGTMPCMLERFRIVELGRDGALILCRREMERTDPSALTPMRTAIGDSVGPYCKAAIGSAGEIDRAVPILLDIAPAARRRIGCAEQTDVATFR